MRLLAAGAGIALAGLLLSLLASTRSEAAPPGGLDISWPQCGKPLPAVPPGFVVVGVDGGKAYTQNPCFREQFRWAGSAGTMPSIYLTLRSPQGATAVRGLTGPNGACQPGNDACIASNYGYNAAQHAYALAQQQVAPPASTMWWLDVETQSHWSNDTAMNTRVIQGAIDFFNQRGVMLGIYSTRSQWREITGNFSPALPVWIAGAHDAADAPAMCTPRHAFGGGQLWMVQYIADDLDHNHNCGESIATTILTRTVTSAGMASQQALRVAEPVVPVEPPPAVEAAPPPPPPPPPVELTHLDGTGLWQQPSPATSTTRCAAVSTAGVVVGHPRTHQDRAADRPRTAVPARRRRTVDSHRG